MGARVALCHEWLAARHGSEKTFDAMASAVPTADLYALTWNKGSGLHLGGRPVGTTFLDRVPGLRNQRMAQLPLMPLAWRYASPRRYDVVVTSSHCFAKAFRPAREALQLCYCYTPVRYVWLADLDRRRERGRLSDALAAGLRHYDLRTVRWVDEFAAISSTVRERIERLYDRPARVIHPPVDVELFTPDPDVPRDGFALAVSRLVGYKRLDLAIRACHRVGHPLVVAGAGGEEAELRALAQRLSADVRFAIDPSDEQLRHLYRSADVLVFPAEEDFGIVPVEAQACGTPVVALARGGTSETVIPGTSGVLVPAQDEASLAEGIEAVLNARLDPADCRRSAERFSAARFRDSFLDWVIGTARARGIEVEDPRAATVA